MNIDVILEKKYEEAKKLEIIESLSDIDKIEDAASLNSDEKELTEACSQDY